MRRVVFLASLTILAARTVAAIDVTSCGATLPETDTGVLQVDLDCAGAGPYGVRLLRKATLDLNGHSITGGPVAPTVLGVETSDGSGRGDFTIRGPGSIAGTSPDAFPFLNGNACVMVSDGRARITSATGVVEISGCETGVLGGTRGPSFGGQGRVTMDHVDLHDHWLQGLAAKRLVATDVTVHDHVRGIGMAVSRRMSVEDVMVHHNNVGIAAGTIVGSDVTASDNIGPDPNAAGGNAIFSDGLVSLTNLVATGNTNPAITARSLKLVDSQVTNNGLREPHLMVDIQSVTRPRLINTVCLHSEATGAPRPGPEIPDWDVCLDD